MNVKSCSREGLHMCSDYTYQRTQTSTTNKPITMSAVTVNGITKTMKFPTKASLFYCVKRPHNIS